MPSYKPANVSTSLICSPCPGSSATHLPVHCGYVTFFTPLFIFRNHTEMQMKCLPRTFVLPLYFLSPNILRLGSILQWDGCRLRQIPNSFSFVEKAKSKQEASIFQRWTPKCVGLEQERGKSHCTKNRMLSFLLSTFGFIAANNILKDKSTD